MRVVSRSLTRMFSGVAAARSSHRRSRRMSTATGGRNSRRIKGQHLGALQRFRRNRERRRASAVFARTFSAAPVKFVSRLSEERRQDRTRARFADRVAYQRAIEEVYWRHRIWPKENAEAKPPLDKVMSQAQIEKKVEDYLRDSQALEDYWQRPITPDQLQAEMERIASHTKQPEVLREIFQALGDDPLVIAECLARPVLAQRLVTELNKEGSREANESRVAKGGSDLPRRSRAKEGEP